MLREFPGAFSTEHPILFGKSRMGRDLQEYCWGTNERSIIFLSGFSSEDRPLSEMLLRWKYHLTESEEYGGILGDFDLKSLRSKCRIRIFPILNPDAFEINRNGLKKENPFYDVLLKSKENSTDFSVIRTNLRGVNLNRNFNANWLKMRKDHPDWESIGPFPESEVETAAITSFLRKDLPSSAVILTHGDSGLFYPEEATHREIREAVFLGQYGGLPVTKASHTEGTSLQWFTDRGVKTIEIKIFDTSPAQYTKLRNLLTMCAALT